MNCEELRLRKNTAHVWMLELSDLFPEDRYLRDLSKDELSRASRYKYAELKFAFIKRRFFLRNVLSRYIKCPPQELRFSFSDYGKPYISQKENPNSIKFNYSYSKNICILAVNRNHEVGIDIEKLHTIKNPKSLAKQFFCANEISYIENAHSTNECSFRFLQVWTRKEAVLKACGLGISEKLNSIDVIGMNPTHPISNSLEFRGLHINPLFLHEPDLCAGYLIALAKEGDLSMVQSFRFKEK